MNIKIVISEAELTKLVLTDLANKLGDIPLDFKDVKIEVKSKQNFRSEWETAEFRAVYEKNTLP